MIRNNFIRETIHSHELLQFSKHVAFCNGHCEVDPDKECAWSTIYRMLEREDRLDNLREILPLHPHNRTTTPGTVIHPAYKRRYGTNE